MTSLARIVEFNTARDKESDLSRTRVKIGHALIALEGLHHANPGLVGDGLMNKALELENLCRARFAELRGM